MRPNRAIIAALGALALAVALVMLREQGADVGWMPGCTFHRLTGLHCPGCGMTRATVAAARGDLAAAFRFNPVGMVVLPLALLGLGLEVLGWVRGKRLGWHPGPRLAWLLVWVIAGFWILRNFPWWPFTLLAPP
jgi:hypothetical protein